MSITVTSGPSIEPVTVDEARGWLGLPHMADDQKIEGLIISARTHTENILGRALMPQTIVQKHDCFPPWVLELKRSPVRTLTSIEYIDGSGVTQTWATSNYVVDLASTPPRIMPAEGKSYPVTDKTFAAVTVTYEAGYTNASAVPRPLRHAVTMLVDHFYEHGSPVTELRLEETPMSYRSLVAPYRVY